jgi:hypothetical protein
MVCWVAPCPASLDDFRVFLQELFAPLGVPADELSYFIDRLLIVATSCSERRFVEFENIAWWDFIAAPKMSSGQPARTNGKSDLRQAAAKRSISDLDGNQRVGTSKPNRRARFLRYKFSPPSG